MAQSVLIRALKAEFRLDDKMRAMLKRVTFPKLYNLLRHLPGFSVVDLMDGDKTRGQGNGRGTR